jgi:hypothetical protein
VAYISVVWLSVVNASGLSHEPRGVTSKRRVEIFDIPRHGMAKKGDIAANAVTLISPCVTSSFEPAIGVSIGTQNHGAHETAWSWHFNERSNHEASKVQPSPAGVEAIQITTKRRISRARSS